MNIKDSKICVVGLGYVGLPLAVAFGGKKSTVGFDINKYRINQLKKDIDITGECSQEQLNKSKKLKFYLKKDFPYNTITSEVNIG